jgi:dolichol-phosphate mannosyltransferase
LPALSVVILAWSEAGNLRLLLPRLHAALAALDIGYEVIVADGGSNDGTEDVCRAGDAVYLAVGARGYGLALGAGFRRAAGSYVLTMDADFSHPESFLRMLWERRGQAELLVASRYCPGGSARMPWTRRWLSRTLNLLFSAGLDLPVRDCSSGYRLYRADVLDGLAIRAREFDALQEILIRVHASGHRILEVPFDYQPRRNGTSHARVLAFGVQYLKTFGRMWRLRNSIESGDYDLRAFDSRLPPQRWWQRRRHRIVTGFVAGAGAVLDVGCGSSCILGDLPAGSVGLDPNRGKLRHARRFGRWLVQGGLPHLPFGDGTFPVIVCSQVIEHIHPDEGLWGEFRRVLVPGGILVLGTPDYGRLAWRITERLYGALVPGGYADEHITRYTRHSLTEGLVGAGFEILEYRYIGAGELILRCRSGS